MLSRVADAIYWMNRYIERAENYARFIDVNYNLSLEMPPNSPEQWKPLIITTGDWALYRSQYSNVKRGDAIFFLGFDPDNPSSVYSCIVAARENARSIRPEITREVWEQINAMYHMVKDGHARKLWKKKDPRPFFSDIKFGCQLLYGILDATIARTEGWHFGNIGKLLERADKTSRILDVKYHILLPSSDEVGTTQDLIQWAALLKSASAYDMYRKKFGRLSVFNIVQFLVFDQDFPRAMLRCLDIAEKSFNVISAGEAVTRLTSRKQLGLLKASLEYSDTNDVIRRGMHEFLDGFQLQLNEISASIFEDFFSISNIALNQPPK